MTIFADEAKRRYDIVIPQLTRALGRSDSALSQLNPARRPGPQDVALRFRTSSRTSTSNTAAVHLIDKGIIEEYEFHVPYAEDPSGVITYYTRSVAKAGGVERLVWRVRHARADGPRLPEGPRVRAARSSWRTRSSCAGWPRTTPRRSWSARSARRSVRWRSPSASRRSPRTRFRVSDTPPFPWSRQTVEGERHGLQPHACRQLRWRRASRSSSTEATDVAAWAKLTMNSRFALEYISKAGALRYYYPDFVVRLTDDSCLIVETKGQEDLDVALKDRRARRWCEDATRLAGANGPMRRSTSTCSTSTLEEISTVCDAS